jgi:hypothetical protein
LAAENIKVDEFISAAWKLLLVLVKVFLVSCRLIIEGSIIYGPKAEDMMPQITSLVHKSHNSKPQESKCCLKININTTLHFTK